jgi:3-hydroxyisobutyrate dehydrogenase-like beta-hydroxyacid dehydrogenase
MASGTGFDTIRSLESAHAKAKQTLIAVPVLGRPDWRHRSVGNDSAGPEEALKRCEPLFKLLSRRVFYGGSKPESASAMKLANNAVLGCAITAMAEGFSLVRKHGVDPQVLYDVMTDGLFSGAIAYIGYGKTMVEGTFDRVVLPHNHEGAS